MLKTIACILLVFAWADTARAATLADVYSEGTRSKTTTASKEFSLTFDFLTALHFCKWANDYALERQDAATAGPVEMMKNLMVQNHKFDQGLMTIREYVKDP